MKCIFYTDLAEIIQAWGGHFTVGHLGGEIVRLIPKMGQKFENQKDFTVFLLQFVSIAFFNFN